MIRQVSTRKSQQGTAAVETALVLPLLLFMMLGIAELGQLVLHYNELTKSARDAARYLAGQAIAGSTEVIVIGPDLKAETVNLAVYGNTGGTGSPAVNGLTTADVDVDALDSVHVRVTIDFQYNPLLGLDSLPTFGFTERSIDVAVPLRASAVMRAL